jgi:hypothetical protein
MTLPDCVQLQDFTKRCVDQTEFLLKQSCEESSIGAKCQLTDLGKLVKCMHSDEGSRGKGGRLQRMSRY